MYSEEVKRIRKEMLDLEMQIIMIEKNHHLEGKEKEDALVRLKELKKIRDDMHIKLKYQMLEDYEKQARGGRK